MSELPRRRVDRIQQFLREEKINGKIVRIRHVNLFLGPVRCFRCQNLIRSGESVWRVVVEKPQRDFDDGITMRTQIRFLGVREYRLCLECEPPPRMPMWSKKA